MPELPDNAIATVGNILSEVDRKVDLLHDLKNRSRAKVSLALSEVFLEYRFLLILAKFNQLGWDFYREPMNVEIFNQLSQCDKDLMAIVNSLTSPSDHL